MHSGQIQMQEMDPELTQGGLDSKHILLFTAYSKSLQDSANELPNLCNTLIAPEKTSLLLCVYMFLAFGR